MSDKLLAENYVQKPLRSPPDKTAAITKAKATITSMLPSGTSTAIHERTLIAAIRNDPDCHLLSLEDCQSIIEELRNKWHPGGQPNEFSEV